MKKCLTLIFLLAVSVGTPSSAGEIPDPVEALVQKASIAMKNGELTESVALAREILAQNPEHATALSLLGSALVGLGEMTEARTVLEKCRAVDSRSPIPLLSLGESWIREDKEKAKTLWNEALALEPDIPAHYARIAWALIYQAEYIDGALIVNRGLKRFPGSRSLLLAAAFLAEKNDEFQNAQKVYALIFADNSKDIEATARSVTVLSIMGQLDKAEVGLEYLRTLEDDPKFIHYAEGFYYLFMEDGDKSLAAHLKAVEYPNAPHDSYAIQHSVGNLYFAKKQYKEACEHYELARQLIERHPGLDRVEGRCDLFSFFGLSLYELGRFEEAAKCFASSIQDGYGLFNDYVKLANILTHWGQVDRAIDVLAQGAGKFPKHPAFPLISALILIDHDRAAQAKPLLEKFLASPPEEASPEDIERAKVLLADIG